MPDAGRTREPCVQRNCTLRTQATTGQPNQPAFPARWFTPYTWSPRCTGLFSHRRLAKRLARLDPSVGGSGQHDFARPRGMLSSARYSRAEHPERPPLPASNVRDDRDTSLSKEAGCPEVITIFRKTEGKYFCKGGLT